MRRARSNTLLYARLALTFLVAACDPGPIQRVTPEAPILPKFPNVDVESQSEPAMVRTADATSPDGGAAMRFVVAFNDDTLEADAPPGFVFPEVTYTAAGLVDKTRLGASGIGWSRGGEPGWTHGGKIRPALTDISGAALTTADPAVAVDPVDPQVVYFTMMGTARATWDNLTKQASETTLPLPNDILCVARSKDAGATFPEFQCFDTLEDADVNGQTDFPDGTPGLDQTAAVVDASRCLWVAYNQTSPPRRARIARLTGNGGAAGCGPGAGLGSLNPKMIAGGNQSPTTCAEAREDFGCCGTSSLNPDRESVFFCQAGSLTELECTKGDSTSGTVGRRCAFSEDIGGAGGEGYDCVPITSDPKKINVDPVDPSRAHLRACAPHPAIESDTVVGDAFIRLRTGPDGSVWFGTMKIDRYDMGGKPTVIVRQYSGVSGQVLDVRQLHTRCTTDDPIGELYFPPAGDRLAKVAVPWDFVVHDNRTGARVITAAFQYPVHDFSLPMPASAPNFIRAIEVDVTTGSCAAPGGWFAPHVNPFSTPPTALPSAFQPTIVLQPIQGSIGRADAALGYITNAGSPDLTNRYLHHEVWPLNAFTADPSTFLSWRPKLLTPVNSFACGELEAGGHFYWGDYWSLVGTTDPAGRSVVAAAFSFSKLDGSSVCGQQTADIARALHVGFTVWRRGHP